MSNPGNLYADLSRYYDQFCAEVDYAEQCAFAGRVFALLVSSGGRDYLDLACGTGQHLQLMAAADFVCAGLDNSEAMLQLAAIRCPAAQLQLCDLAAFEQVAAFDLISCFLYSIHYIHPLAALEQTMQRAWVALKPGGVFVFDAVDARGIDNDKVITTRLTDYDALMSFQSGWQYAGNGEVLDLVLVISRESAAGTQLWQDQHTMTAVTLPLLRHMLESTGFDVSMLEHDYTRLQQWDGESFNAIFLARKPGKDEPGQTGMALTKGTAP